MGLTGSRRKEVWWEEYGAENGLRPLQLLMMSGAQVADNEIVDEYGEVNLQVIATPIEREHQQVDMYESPEQAP